MEIIFDDGIYRIYKIDDNYEIYRWYDLDCVGSFNTKEQAFNFLGL
jgi:hypothetical protein